MAEHEITDALRKGVSAFEQWREQHPDDELDLRGAVLDGLDLEYVDLRGADLRGASLRGTRLVGAKLDRCRAAETDLTDASMTDASMEDSTFGFNSRLHRADLSQAYLSGTTFSQADLCNADFACAVLHGTRFYDCNVAQCQFGWASFIGVAFHNMDLSIATGLDRGDMYYGPSYFDLETLRRSRGRLPDRFLRYCGLSDVEVAISKLWDPELSQAALTDLLYSIDRLRGSQPIQRNAVFLSYSHHDELFVTRLHDALDRSGVRCWRDVHDLTAGRIEKQVDRAIRVNAAVIVVLSQHSIGSDWVEWEASRARDVEKEENRDVLCPVALDDSWKSCSWPGPLRQQLTKYHILDFGRWHDKSSFDSVFSRLLAGLDAFYRRPETTRA